MPASSGIVPVPRAASWVTEVEGPGILALDLSSHELPGVVERPSSPASVISHDASVRSVDGVAGD